MIQMQLLWSNFEHKGPLPLVEILKTVVSPSQKWGGGQDSSKNYFSCTEFRRKLGEDFLK
jgi:hypothetical protein